MYEMTKETFKLGYNTQTKMAFVFKAKDEMTKNHQESDNPIVSGYMPQILSPDGTVSKLCPVRSYKNYLAHLNEKCEYLWQTANPAAYEKGNPVWYKNKRVGENTLGSFVSDICTLVKSSKKYTNHCLRVTGITNLTARNFTPRQIMSVSGHKSIQSLSLYQRVKTNEKLMMGMSLAYSLYHANAVENSVVDANDFDVPAIEPPKENVQPEHPILPNVQKQIIPVETAVVPYHQPQDDTTGIQEDFNFDIMDIINDVNEQEMVLAATQMEQQITEDSSKTKTTSVIKKPASPLKMSPFTNCKIGSIGTININFYKQ